DPRSDHRRYDEHRHVVEGEPQFESVPRVAIVVWRSHAKRAVWRTVRPMRPSHSIVPRAPVERQRAIRSLSSGVIGWRPKPGLFFVSPRRSLKYTGEYQENRADQTAFGLTA